MSVQHTATHTSTVMKMEQMECLLGVATNAAGMQQQWAAATCGGAASAQQQKVVGRFKTNGGLLRRF